MMKNSISIHGDIKLARRAGEGGRTTRPVFTRRRGGALAAKRELWVA